MGPDFATKLALPWGVMNPLSLIVETHPVVNRYRVVYSIELVVTLESGPSQFFNDSPCPRNRFGCWLTSDNRCLQNFLMVLIEEHGLVGDIDFHVGWADIILGVRHATSRVHGRFTLNWLVCQQLLLNLVDFLVHFNAPTHNARWYLYCTA